jgi:hypothetical protein
MTRPIRAEARSLAGSRTPSAARFRIRVAIAAAPAAAADPLCWICKQNKADSGEHKTKRSDLKAVLGPPTQEASRFEHRRDLGHPHSRTSSKRFQIADFMYSKRDDAELEGSSAAP